MKLGPQMADISLTTERGLIVNTGTYGPPLKVINKLTRVCSATVD